LAQNSAGQTEAALSALVKGAEADPNDPGVPYARATILSRAGRLEEANRAARRALALQPDFTGAARLLETLAR